MVKCSAAEASGLAISKSATTAISNCRGRIRRIIARRDEVTNDQHTLPRRPDTASDMYASEKLVITVKLRNCMKGRRCKQQQLPHHDGRCSRIVDDVGTDGMVGFFMFQYGQSVRDAG